LCETSAAQLVEQVGGGAEQHAACGGARLQTQAKGQVRLAEANEQHVGRVAQERQIGNSSTGS
jgi:hypothetical protein